MLPIYVPMEYMEYHVNLQSYTQHNPANSPADASQHSTPLFIVY